MIQYMVLMEIQSLLAAMSSHLVGIDNDSKYGLEEIQALSAADYHHV